MNYTYYRRYRPPKKRETFSSFFWFVIILLVGVLLLKACASSIADKNQEKRDEAVLSIDQGAAEITLWGEDEAEPAANSQIVLEGDEISTKDATYATLSFYNGSKIFLDQNTTLNFSDVSADGADDFLTLDLKDGRIFVKQIPNEEGEMQIKIKTDVMNIASYQTQYLASNIPDNEYIYVFNGESEIELVDRSGGNDVVIEKTVLKSSQKIAVPDSKQKSLLARDSVTLLEDAGDDLVTDSFYIWTLMNDGIIEETSTGTVSDETEDPLDATGSVSEANTLVISVISPISPATIEKDGVAIEGNIMSGTAEKVTVTWDGNKSPYTLQGFKAGGSTFRFVATSEYKNLALGSNTYTVIAYDAEGNASNTVVVKVNASF